MNKSVVYYLAVAAMALPLAASPAFAQQKNNTRGQQMKELPEGTLSPQDMAEERAMIRKIEADAAKGIGLPKKVTQESINAFQVNDQMGAQRAAKAATKMLSAPSLAGLVRDGFGGALFPAKRLSEQLKNRVLNVYVCDIKDINYCSEVIGHEISRNGMTEQTCLKAQAADAVKVKEIRVVGNEQRLNINLYKPNNSRRAPGAFTLWEAYTGRCYSFDGSPLDQNQVKALAAAIAWR